MRSSYTEREAKPFSRLASRNLLLLLMGGILLLAGCSKLLPGGGSTSSGANPAGGQTTAASFERSLQLTQPRAMTYANLQYTVTKAIISDRVADELPPDSAKRAVADLSFSVVNNLKEGVVIRGGWQLKLGDGSVYKRTYEDDFQAADKQDRKISFRVPLTAQWAGAQITLDEQDKEPGTMALDGNAPLPQTVIALNVKRDEKTTQAPTMTYAIRSANIDMDAFGQRAALGKRFLNVTVHVAYKDAGDSAQFLPEFFRLLIDGSPSAPEHASSNSVLANLGSQDYTMAYVIPANATNLELGVGKPDVQETARIPFDLTP